MHVVQEMLWFFNSTSEKSTGCLACHQGARTRVDGASLTPLETPSGRVLSVAFAATAPDYTRSRVHHRTTRQMVMPKVTLDAMSTLFP